jgi:hypothetical protein
VLALGVAAGCGDDDGDNPAVDGGPRVDSGGDVDAEPPAPLCFNDGYDCAEGGEVRFEYINFVPGAGPGGRSTATRATAYFTSGGDPAHYPLPAVPGCTEMQLDDHWPVAQPDPGRTYLDVGDVVIAGGPQTLVIDDIAAGTDFIFRSHDIWKFHFGVDDGPTFISGDTAYDVILTGSATFPFTRFEDVLYVPTEYNVTNPGRVATTMPAATDFVVDWEVQAPTNAPAGYRVDSLVGVLLGGGVGPIMLCTEEGNDGSITIPAATVDRIREIAAAQTPPATGGTLARQTLSHVTRELNDGAAVNNRRIDFVGVWCFATPVSFPAP